MFNFQSGLTKAPLFYDWWKIPKDNTLENKFLAKKSLYENILLKHLKKNN